MRTSPNGIRLIKSFESFRALAYLCPAGVWTIGYGFTDGVREGDAIKPEEAERRLSRELTRFEAAVRSGAGECNQNEFDAMVSLAFNIGIAGFLGSSVVKAHKRWDHQSAAAAFSLWNKVKGKPVAGLTRRRAAEAALYLTAIPDDVSDPADQPAMPQAVDAEKPMTSSKINMAQATTGTIATVGAVNEGVKAFADLKDGVSDLGTWLVPLACVAVVLLCGFTIWQRYDLRKRGVV